VNALLATWRGRFILAMVASQLVLPIHYYLVRADKHDERFAWRMFSPMRMAQCTPAVTIDGAPFDLASKFHEAWLSLASRGRASVIEAMAARMCQDHPGKPVVVSVQCTYIDRPPQTFGGHDLCQNPRL
jgi:hypothetical protein